MPLSGVEECHPNRKHRFLGKGNILFDFKKLLPIRECEINVRNILGSGSIASFLQLSLKSRGSLLQIGLEKPSVVSLKLNKGGIWTSSRPNDRCTVFGPNPLEKLEIQHPGKKERKRTLINTDFLKVNYVCWKSHVILNDMYGGACVKSL